MEEQITKFLGAMILYAGGPAAIAFVLFKTLGEKWLDSKFSERLKSVEYRYQFELSELKQRLDTAASGLNRIHQKEFEVLPEAWGLLDEAMNTLKWVISPLQSYVDVGRLQEEEWVEFVEELTHLSNSEKKYLKSIYISRERQKAYNKISDNHRGALAQKAIREFQNYSARNSIFLPENLRDQFDRIRELLWSASVTKSMGREIEDWEMQQKAWKELDEKVEPLFHEIRKSIQDRIAHQSKLNIDGLSIDGIRR